MEHLYDLIYEYNFLFLIFMISVLIILEAAFFMTDFTPAKNGSVL